MINFKLFVFIHFKFIINGLTKSMLSGAVSLQFFYLKDLRKKKKKKKMNQVSLMHFHWSRHHERWWPGESREYPKKISGFVLFSKIPCLYPFKKKYFASKKKKIFKFRYIIFLIEKYFIQNFKINLLMRI